MSSWSEIQKLAADLQRIQFSDSVKKLSDANCIEVVSKLISKSLIDVVFTRDGRSYVTKKYLETEVKNEVEAAGARATLTDIAANLNVDFNHVDRTARILSENGYILRNGELFAQEYVTKLRLQLDKLLSEEGSRTVSFLCKHWDLSQDLLKSLVLEHISDTNGLLMDGDVIYTSAYLEKHNSILSAVLLPKTQPTLMTDLMRDVGLPHKRFWASFDELVKKGKISGRLLGSRTSTSCSFVPRIYDAAVKKYAVSHYKQKEYLELSIARKLGLNETLQSIKEVLETEDVEMLPTLALTPALLEQLISAAKENISGNNGVCDVQSVLQTQEIPLELADIEAICSLIAKQESNLHCFSAFVFTASFLKKVLIELSEAIETKAQDEFKRLENEKKQKAGAATKKTDADDDWSDGKKNKKKGGKGSQAKGGGKSRNAEDEQAGVHNGIETTDIEDWLKNVHVVPEELISIIAENIHQEVNDKLHKRVSDLMTAVLTGNAQSEKKKLERLHANAVRLYETFSTLEASTSKYSPSLASDLNAHIVKTFGTQLVTTILSYVSGVDDIEKMSEKQRNEVIGSLPSESKDKISELYEAVKSSNGQELHSGIEKLSKQNTIDLRALSEKAMTNWTNNYIHDLKNTVGISDDPASVLLSSVLLLLASEGKPTAASGKFVQRLIAELDHSIPKSLHELLVSCQQGVVNCIKNKNDDVAKEMLSDDIKKLTQAVLSE